MGGKNSEQKDLLKKKLLIIFKLHGPVRIGIRIGPLFHWLACVKRRLIEEALKMRPCTDETM